MGLVDRVSARARPVARAADPVTYEEFGQMLTGIAPSASGVTVGPARALGITAWYSGVRYLSETVASLPCHTYRDTAAGGRQRRADPPWRRNVDIDLPWMSWVEFQVMSLVHRGDGFSFKLRDPAGRVVGLRPLHPDRMRVGRDPDTQRKVFVVDGSSPMFTTRDILHIPGLSYDGLRGIDVIRYQGQALGTSAAADEYAARFFDAGSHVDQYIQLDDNITPEKALARREEFQVFHRGLGNAHELALLGGGAKLESIGLDPAQTQLLESRKYGVTEVARILRIPPHKLYDLERATFSNIEHQSIEAVVDSIRPWVVRIEAHVNHDPDLMPPRNFIEFQVEGLLRGDQKARFESYSRGILTGFMNRNEPRRLENLPEAEGLDEFLVPVNMRGINDPVPTQQPQSPPAPEEVA